MEVKLRWRLTAAVLSGSLVVAGCGSGDRDVPHAGGTPIQGGTAYFAEQPGSPPDYIFPLVSGQDYTPANVDDLQTLLYRPLYWYGSDNRPVVDYQSSLANAPRYSDGDRRVTVTLKPAHWSDGEAVSARDVGFWINLLKANRDEWASYVPGGFPDNVVSWRATDERTIVLELDRAYNPTWFTNNELSQITPLPLAWDRTTTPAAHAAVPAVTATGLPDTTPAGARAVYRFLDRESRALSGYADSPIWSVVDGPWRLQSLTAEGEATFIPNRSYDGPDHPRLARFVELPFTSEASEFSVLRSGSPTGDSSGGTQISVGWVPDTDLPAASQLESQGYRLTPSYQAGFDYLEPNFNNPSVGPIFKQLYFRQAFQHLIDQRGWIRAYYGGLGVPTYSPVPARPANPYSDAAAERDPYPFSVEEARSLLSAHGWRVVNGVETCSSPGAGPHQCGIGIPAGKRLQLTLMYPNGLSYTDGAMTDLQAVAARAGIRIELREESIGTVTAAIEPCQPSQAACSWQLGQYGQPWVYAPDHYPTGEEIFQTGALGNVGSYSDPSVDRLIRATTTVPAGRTQATLDAYADRVRLELPDFWQPSPGTMLAIADNLAGVHPNAYGFISPERWYLVR